MSSLRQSPFHLLGVTTRDDRRRIVALAEEKSLELDAAVSQKARSDLAHPRTRLTAEVAWLPGVSPNRAAQLVELALRSPDTIRGETGLPLLAHANLLAEAFGHVSGDGDPEEIAGYIDELARLVDELSSDGVAREINEDRAVAGFPEVRVDHVEAELAERKRYFKDVIKAALNRMPPTALIATLTSAVEDATAGGEIHAPELIDELVDSYEVEAQGFLQAEAENVRKLIRSARDAAGRGEAAVRQIVDKLEVVVRNWDRVAQPIQLSAKARGLNHDPSQEIALSVRSLAVDLFNEQGMLEQANRITAFLQEVFAELPEASERFAEDAQALEEIAQKRQKSEADRKEWERELTYSVNLGTVFKSILAISPDGVWWKSQHYPLDAVTRIRWGAIRKTVNGIPAGTTFTVAFGDNGSEAVAEFSNETVFGNFVDRLWRGVGVRLLVELLTALRAGQRVNFGDAVVHDNGVVLTRHKFFGANEQVPCTWNQVHIWTADGSFYIGSKDDKKVHSSMSYIYTPNSHVLEHAIRAFFKDPNTRRPSELLRGT
jgi:hypothetical protein